MTLLRPWAMQASGSDSTFQHSAADMRNIISGMWHDQGVQDAPFGSFKVSQRGAGANFSVDVAAGKGWVFGDDAAGQGIYGICSTAVENLVIPSPPVSGTRTHRVVAHVRDKAHDASLPDDTYDFVLEVLEDTGSGTPAVPDSAIPLARVAVASTDASVLDAAITDDRTSACLITSKFPIVDQDSTRPPNGYDGELIWRSDKGCYEVCVTGTWYEMSRRDGGGSAWTTYTPTLTAVSVNPNMGTSPTRTGRYIREGRKVTVNITLKFGSSGVTAGTGFYELALPFAAKALTVGRQVGSVYVFDNSGSDFADGVCFTDPAGGTKLRMSIDSTVVSNSSPWTWAANDEIGLTITYEAAS